MSILSPFLTPSGSRNCRARKGAGDGVLELDLVKVNEVLRVEVGRIKTKSAVSDPVGNRDL